MTSWQVASSQLDITERELEGVRILEVSGDLDLACAAELCARVQAGHRRLLIDLRQLEFCDSSGLRALIGAAAEVRASAGRVVMVPPVDGAVARLFALAGVDELLPLRSSVAEGLTAIGTRRRTMANPVPAGSDVSAGTYRCTNCGYELQVGSTEHLPPCPSCQNGEYETVSGGDSVDDPYPDRQ